MNYNFRKAAIIVKLKSQKSVLGRTVWFLVELISRMKA